jgi:putative thioredoxin
MLVGMAVDVTQDNFQQAVVDRSREVPVVVDFWAEWCGPCRALTPALERAAEKRAGQVELVKVDTDANQQLAAQYGIQGIPAVKAFRNGQIVDEFVGALPAAQVERFFDGLVPTEADKLVSGGDEESLRRALEIEPGRADAATALGRMLLERGDTGGAREVLDNVSGDFVAEGLAARAHLLDEGADAGVGEGLRALGDGDPQTGLEKLDAAFAGADAETRDLIRKVMVGVFSELGADHALAREYRRRLAAALY